MDGLMDGVADGMQGLEDGVPEGLIAAPSVWSQAEGLLTSELTVWQEETEVEGLPGTRARAGLT